MCYISTGLGLNFCFPLLKWANSCYSNRDDIWRQGRNCLRVEGGHGPPAFEKKSYSIYIYTKNLY